MKRIVTALMALTFFCGLYHRIGPDMPRIQSSQRE
jgi:hypothetical protein